MSLMILAYFGPETTLPVVSVLATVIGCVLMMARVSKSWLLGMIRSDGPKVVEKSE